MERKLQVKIAAAVLVALPVKTPRNRGNRCWITKCVNSCEYFRVRCNTVKELEIEYAEQFHNYKRKSSVQVECVMYMIEAVVAVCHSPTNASMRAQHNIKPTSEGRCSFWNVM
jgi:hypothetical protein